MVDARVKERLTGAIILVALLVLLVPELLSGSGPSAAATLTAPNAEGQQMRSYTIDLGADAAAPRSASVVASPAPSPAVPESSPVAAPGAASSDAQSGEAMAQAGESVVRPAPDDRATAAAEAPTAAAPGSGPTATPPRSASTVTPPPRGAPQGRPASPAASRVASSERRIEGGWAVQVGSFASRENAERLARELKGKGFDSHVSESSGNGKRLWRVRVGPEPDRASAVALGARLRAKGQSGSVVPMP
jgi:DedD protein